MADRDLRGLTGAGPSQVGVGGAMRARDVSRPGAAELAAAELAAAAGRAAGSDQRRGGTRRRQPLEPGDDNGGSTPEVS